MLVELKGRVHPRYFRELSGGRVHAKLLRWAFPFPIDAVMVVAPLPAVTPPRQSRLLQALRQRRVDLDCLWSPPGRSVDDRRVGAEEQEVIRCGRSGDIRVVVIAEAKLPRIGKVRGYVLLDELLAGGGRLSGEPRGMGVRMIPRGRIRRSRQSSTVRTGEGAEVVVERMVLFEDDHHMLDLFRRNLSRPTPGQVRARAVVHEIPSPYLVLAIAK